MSEKWFDELDEQSRNAAEHYEAPFNEAAWIDMESRLNRNTSRKRRYAAWWWADMLMIAGLLLILLSFPRHYPSAVNSFKDHELATAKQQPVQQMNKAELKESSLPQTTLKRNQGAGKANESFAHHIKAKAFDQHSSNPLLKADLNPLNEVAQTENAAISPTADNDKNKAIEVHSAAPLHQETIATAASKNDSLAANQVSALVSEDSNGVKNAVAAKENHSRNKHTQPVYLYAQASPEWSVIMGNKVGKTVLAYGAGMGYQFNRRWALQAGLNIARKRYAAEGKYYHPKPGSYYAVNPVTYVDADCFVAEIPVQVRYNVIIQQKQQWFISAGLSTAIMNKEQYRYNYLRYGLPAETSRTYRTHSWEWMASAVLSAGYEKPLTQGLSLQASPYFSIPLSGVGVGSVRISSAGLSLGIKYRPNIKRR